MPLSDASRNDPENENATILNVDDLVLLRGTVENWAERAANAVLEFKREDGSFWKDSKTARNAKADSAPNITTSARAYIALLYADRRSDTSKGRKEPEWVSSLAAFMNKASIGRLGRHFYEAVPKAEGGGSQRDKYEVNTFDIAHLTDFIQVAEYLARFHGGDIRVTNFFKSPDSEDKSPFKFKEDEPPSASNQRLPSADYDRLEAREAIKHRLLEAIKDAAQPTETGVGFPGEVRFEEGRPESRHYFATLHTLRALHVLGESTIDGLAKIVSGAKSFAVEQCYYFQRGTTHRQDPVRLAFAGCIYAIYEDHVDKDLCLAIIQALAAAQQPNGSWPATHPVFRESNVPWHIASHEVALCLSWLYFQPRVPDSARPLLLGMMRKYLLNAVIPTFFRAGSGAGDPTASGTAQSEVSRKYHGWQDDHTVSPDRTLGWATAIICHFLAGFARVLDDWINRRVIEELGLELSTERYLIDDTASKPSLRWAGNDEKPHVWPDLPPHAWSRKKLDPASQTDELSKEWTDPEEKAAICANIANKVLLPIQENPSEQPRRDRCAGLMPGDPGTRKTSLVKEIAKILQWPMVAVPASSIFERGFDMMEARANKVFGLLNHLRGCIIFFDEFEEFFLSRGEHEGEPRNDDTGVTLNRSEASGNAEAKPKEKNGQSDEENREEERVKAKMAVDSYRSRTIAAFTTSAMLPRLQDLHDQTRCLIFLATNDISKLDTAIIREGRFDFGVTVNHPTINRLIEYVGSQLSKKTKTLTGLDGLENDKIDRIAKIVKSALEKLDAKQARLKFAAVEEQLRSIRPTTAEGEAADEEDERLATEATATLRRGLGAMATRNPPPELTSMD